MLAKQCVVSVLLTVLAGACASQSKSLQGGAGSARPDDRDSAVESERRERTERALVRLGELESETTRVANRLKYEGTAEQRAAWDQELHAVEHDRKLLGKKVREAELGDADEWEEEHERLTSMIDALITAGNETAAQIDRALDADRAAARARSEEPAMTATE
jgi:hypothetical protein